MTNMRFLIDVCADSRSLRESLSNLGYQFIQATTIDPQAPDETLLKLALDEQRVLITKDKDFGEPVFVRRLPHPCIVRLVEMTASEQAHAVQELLERHRDAMRPGTLIVVTRNRIRIRDNNQTPVDTDTA